VVYGRLLRELALLPTDSQYRVNAEAIVKHRLLLVETVSRGPPPLLSQLSHGSIQEPDMQKLETLIGMGQLEEVIQQVIWVFGLDKTVYKC